MASATGSRPMPRRPVVRATIVVVALLPVLTYGHARLLAGIGVTLSWQDTLLYVALPLAGAMLLTATVYLVSVSRRALELRAALQRIAHGELGPQFVPRDLLGVRDALEAMRSELDRAMTRLATVDARRRRLFADLSHELATPTTALLGLADMLLDPDRDPARVPAQLRAIDAQAQRLARFVADVRDLAELDDPAVTLVHEDTDLAALAREITMRHAPLPGAPLQLEAAPAFASVDAHRIDQALTNLITNARRFAPPGTSVDVQVRVAGGAVELVVEDAGPGVAEDDLPRLGERLFRPGEARDRNGGGHGLGLSIVRAVAERHEGTVRFDRGPRGGLRVTVRVPRRRGAK